MKKERNRTSTASYILCLIIAFFELLLNQFIRNSYIYLGVIILLLIVITQIVMHFSLHYNSCFILNFVLICVTCIITIITYFCDTFILIEYSQRLKYTVFFNWLIPVTSCIITNLRYSNQSIRGFKRFFAKESYILLILYIPLVFYRLCVSPLEEKLFFPPSVSVNFKPFTTLTNNIIYDIVYVQSYKPLVIYVLSSIILFVPVGFYFELLFDHIYTILKLMIFVFVPISFETIQFYFVTDTWDIERIIFGFAGCLFGACLCIFINSIYKKNHRGGFLRESKIYSSYLSF